MTVSSRSTTYWRVVHAGREDTVTSDETEARNRVDFLRLHFPSSMTTLASQKRTPWVEQDADTDWLERSRSLSVGGS